MISIYYNELLCAEKGIHSPSECRIQWKDYKIHYTVSKMNPISSVMYNKATVRIYYIYCWYLAFAHVVHVTHMIMWPVVQHSSSFSTAKFIVFLFHEMFFRDARKSTKTADYVGWEKLCEHILNFWAFIGRYF